MSLDTPPQTMGTFGGTGESQETVLDNGEVGQPRPLDSYTISGKSFGRQIQTDRFQTRIFRQRFQTRT